MPLIYINNMRSGFFGPDAAEGFLGYAQVRGDHVLWYPLKDIGVRLGHPDIFLFGGKTEVTRQSSLHGNEPVLKQQAEIPFHPGNALHHLFIILLADLQDLGIFKRINVIGSRFSGIKTVHVCRSAATSISCRV